MERNNSGFTLIEILIVVTIIGILAAIAIPSWQEYQRKASRAEARSTMLDIAQKQERYFTNRSTYLAIAAPPAAAPANFQNYSGSEVASRKYDIVVAAGATADIATSFAITATPSNGFSDPTCNVLTLGSDGGKTPAACW